MPKGKVAKVMGEFKRGTLRSGSKEGPKVSKRKQAVAIALSEAGKSRKKAKTGGMARTKKLKREPRTRRGGRVQ